MFKNSSTYNLDVATTYDPQELEIASRVNDCINSGQIGTLSTELGDGRTVTFTTGLHHKYGVPELAMTGIHDIDQILLGIVRCTFEKHGEWVDTVLMVGGKPVLITLARREGELRIEFLSHIWGGPIPVQQCLWTNLDCTFAGLDVDGQQFYLQ
ncbi:hypothetical protein [Devosia sp.]|uniref:hypothetical protein n=1 Tax=Devosia sp. TaxID=1871048 RepID=UPI003F7265A2